MLIRFIAKSPKRLGNGLFWLCFIGFPVTISLNGCVKANIVFGQNQIDLGFANIVETDSMLPIMGTTFVDSVMTTGTGSLLIGGYNDSYFGPIMSRSYLEIVPPGFSYLSNQARFDSMVLYLVPNKTYYGDTSVPVDIYAYQLQQPMQYNYDRANLPVNSFSSVDSFAVLPTPLGHVQQLISPTRHDTVHLKLDSAMGAQFFSDFRSEAQYMSTSTLFLQQFAGLRLSTGPGLYSATAGNIFGFKDSVLVKLWYNDATYNGALTTLQFNYTNKAFQFNEIRSTPPPPLNQFARVLSLPTIQGISSTAPGFNHLAYMDNLLGYNIRISFPSIRNLYTADTSFIKIQRALLIFRPIQGSYDPYIFQLPLQLQLAATNYTNVPGGVVSTGTLNAPYTGTTTYTFDVTSYLQEEINNLAANVNGDGLIMQPVSANQVNQFNRLILGDASYPSPLNNTEYVQTQLVIYYLQVKNTL